MIRLYQDMVERLYLTLLWMKYVRGTEIHDVVSDMTRTYRQLTDTNERSMSQLILQNINHSNPDLTISGMVPTLGKLLLNTRSRHDSGEGDLIDLIVRTLQLPYASSVLSGRTLNSLRKALLLPEEMSGLTSRLNKMEKVCTGCARDFAPNEAMVYVEGDATHPSSLLCFACHRPEMVKCRNCAESVPFGDIYTQKRSKGCESHRKAEVDETTAAPPPEIAPPPSARPMRFATRRSGISRMDRIPSSSNESRFWTTGTSAPPPPADLPQFGALSFDTISEILGQRNGPIAVDLEAETRLQRAADEGAPNAAIAVDGSGIINTGR